MADEQQTAWDSRQKWTELLVRQIEYVLTSNQKDIAGWFESLSDFYDMASCALQDTDGYEQDLKDIELLIFSKKLGARYLSDKEIAQRKARAYPLMRAFFRRVHNELFASGLLVPFQPRRDIKRAIAGYNEK